MQRLHQLIRASVAIACGSLFALVAANRAAAESPAGYWTSASSQGVRTASADSSGRLAWNTPGRPTSYRTRSTQPDEMPMPAERNMGTQGDDFQPDWRDQPEYEYVGPGRGGEGEAYYDEGYSGHPHGGPMHGDCHGGGGCDDPCCVGCGGHGDACCGVDPCACGQPDVCCGDCNPLAYWCWWENLEIFGGVHGFKGPVDLGVNGNFGFDYGINWGFPIPCLSQCYGIGGQLGGRVAHSNYSGAATGVINNTHDDSRDQVFLTAGIFQRTCCGIQWGAAYDYLHDEYYIEANLDQIRAEISYLWASGHEWGFFVRASSTEDEEETPLVLNQIVLPVEWESTDQYALFYRHNFCGGGSVRVFGGWTGEGDGLAGVDVDCPLSECFALQCGFNYLIPEEGTQSNILAVDQPGNPGFSEEAWNVAISLVWYPGGRGCGGCAKGKYMPYFPVADNGTFMVDRPTPGLPDLNPMFNP